MTGGAGGTNLALALLVYTIVTWVGMAWYGRSRWRRQGEVFSVWFGILGRLAPWRTSDDLAAGREPGSRRVVRQPFGHGLIHARWQIDEVVLVAMATGAVMFDGLSQTLPFFQLFGLPGFAGSTVLLFGFLGLVVGAVLLVARVAGRGTGRGGPGAHRGRLHHRALPDLPDRRRSTHRDRHLRPVPARLGPLRDGVLDGLDQLAAGRDDLAHPAAAVVGGHAVGAWAGHATAVTQAGPGADRRSIVRRQIPLAILMVCLTVVTLWSLGQLVVEPAA